MKVVIYGNEGEEMITMDLFKNERSRHLTEYIGVSIKNGVGVRVTVKLTSTEGNLSEFLTGSPKDL